jgi:LmbE family N-acetylglucosaminyl deacetylase
MFPSGSEPVFSYTIKEPPHSNWPGAAVHVRVLDAAGHEVLNRSETGSIEGNHRITLKPFGEGRYILEVSVLAEGRIPVASNRLEFAVNSLPKSILVFCAHQDDETNHPGLIRAAVENDIPIHFVYFTAGDAGGCDRYYMHSCDAARAMDFGETRMGETRASLAHLGISRETIFFLGLPDGGLEQIWKKHPKASDPYLSVLLASDHAPYREAAIPNLPYARESMINAAREFITRYQPDLIVTGHPDERHVDHRTNNWIVVKAMQELLREKKISPATQITTDIAYGAGPQKHAPYAYRKETLNVPGEVARMAQEARWYYQSQDGNHQQAELAVYDKLPREEIHYRILDWKEHEGWNESLK